MKGNLLQGTARGRMGDIVAKVVHGKQILSKYQPIVNNPKSPKQIANRAIFSQASKMLAEMKKQLLNFGVKPLYNVYSGASKSLNNVVIPFIFEHAKNELDPFAHNLIGMRKPLITQGYTGNSFEFSINGEPGALNLSLVSQASTANSGMAYFGSDKKIEGNILICASLTSQADETFPYMNVNNTTDLTPVNVPVDASPIKATGFHATIDEVGNWNYIYQCLYPIEVSDKIDLVNYQTPLKQYAGLGIIYDGMGGIVFADNFSQTQN